MRINSNMSALNAYRNLSTVENHLDKSLERLSSGLRINRAADDAAGLAISEKMNGQVRGLQQASRNSQDGISMLQTAEGAMVEVHSILQRMRELAVQSSNGSLTSNDRGELQKEATQLEQEVTRIADTTEFNTKKLINGQMAQTFSTTGTNATSFDNTKASATSDTKTGVYAVSITSIATKGTIAAATSATGYIDANAVVNAAAVGTLTLNGNNINITATDTLNNVIQKINNISSTTGVTATLTSAPGNFGIQLDTNNYGSKATVNVSGATKDTLIRLGLQDAAGVATNITKAGTDVIGTIDGKTAVGDGVKLTLNDTTSNANGLSVTTIAGTVFNGHVATVTVNNDNTVKFQIGANLNQNLSVSINDMQANALGILNIKVDTAANASAAIDTISKAIDTVSSERSKLGAVQNRLEHTINNLGVSAENITAARSRIQDVDMAAEMMEYTKRQILSQAGTAMLAQANQRPQSILQLLK